MTENVFDYDARQRAEKIVAEINKGNLPENPQYGVQGKGGGTGGISGEIHEIPGGSSQVQDRIIRDGENQYPEWKEDTGFLGDEANGSKKEGPSGQGYPAYNSEIAKDILKGLVITGATAAAGWAGGLVGIPAAVILANNPEAGGAMLRDEIPDIP